MKRSVNYKYLNIMLILCIIYLLYLLRSVWLGVVGKLFSILLPFIIGFVIAYVLYPVLKFLMRKKIPKGFAVFIIMLVLLLTICGTLYFIVPILFNQTINLVNNTSKVISNLANKYSVDMTMVNDLFNKYSSKIISGFGTFITDGSLTNLLGTSIGYISKGLITLIAMIYFLVDMSKIRKELKKIIKKFNTKIYDLIVSIDTEITSYLKGLGIFMIIQFFEYTLLFYLAGHPDFLLIGFLACVTTVIPYFGGIITNVIALIIASVVSPKVFILSLLITIIFPNIDGYLISPKIYDKTNKLPPLLTVFAVFAGSSLFGFIGIVIAVPITIVIMAIVKTYKKEISNSIKIVKNKVQ